MGFNIGISLRKIITFNKINLAPTYKCNAQCAFCYAKGLQKQFPKDLAPENFIKLFDWMDGQKLKRIALLGGEPTIYSHLERMLEELGRRRFRTTIITNALFNKKTLKVFNHIKEKYSLNTNFEINYVKPFVKKHFKKIFERNLTELSKNNFDFRLRYNVTFNNVPVDEIINNLLKSDVDELDICVANSGYSNNEFIPVNRIEQISSYIVEITKACLKNKIKVFLARPLPLCAFSASQRKFLIKNICLRGICFLCNKRVIHYYTVLTVNPDLSIFPCPNLFIKGPNVLLFKNMQEIIRYYYKKINVLRKKPIMRKCLLCNDYLRDMCQGGCLSYKVNNNWELK
jgi:radical SAM protein with 4Fe4S-binding SPASM domain